MKTILKLAIIAVLAYFAFEYFRPRIEEAFGPLGSSSNDPVERCLFLAERAVNEFDKRYAKDIEGHRGYETWARGYRLSQGIRLDAAEACECPNDSCSRAKEALDDLERLMSQVDAEARESKEITEIGPSLRIIRQALRQARELAAH